MEFIDLEKQYDRIKDQLNNNIGQVLSHKKFIMGPEVERLEERLAQYTGRKYAFACSSGTDALVIPLMAYGLTKKDVVFVPAFTFYASAESVNLAGGTPVFIDSDRTYNIDALELERAILSVLEEGSCRPRGIIAVDLFGLPADYNKIKDIAEKYGLFLIEDAAQSFGASYHGIKAGKFGDVAATSFFPAKPLGCYGDGGAIFTDDDEMAKKIYSIRVHGQGENRYDNVRIGLNGRLDTMQAAVLLAKLDIFDEEVKLRQQVANAYRRRLEGSFELPVIPEGTESVWGQFSILAKEEEERNYLIGKLKEDGIPAMVYYPIPLHKQKAYREENAGVRLPICEDFSHRILSLPMHPYLEEEDVEYICQKLTMGLSLYGDKS